MNVYLLSHARKVEPNVTETKHIGIYSSMDIINRTIEKYKNITGFKDYPNEFFVKKHEVISRENKTILTGETVFFLQHEYSVDEGGIIYDYFTDIDIYDNYDDVKKEMEELIKDEVYPKSPDGIYPPHGFTIGEYVLDEDNWTEGFVSWDSIS